MSELKIGEYIGEALSEDALKNAADFLGYLLENEFEFERGTGYWADKLYWMIKCQDEYVCFIVIDSGTDKIESGGWIIWTDDSGSNWFEDSVLDEHMKEIAWKHIDICGNCGGCKNPGGNHKTIFGKEYDKVCITPMRFDNPDAETVACIKKLAYLRKKDILKKSKT